MQSFVHRSRWWSRPTLGALLVAATIVGGALQIRVQARAARPVAQAPITLQLWHTYNVAEAARFGNEIAQYQKLNPGIKVSLYEIPYQQRQTKVPTAVQTNTLPDILRADYPYQFYLGALNKALPLNPYVTGWDGYKDIPAWLWQHSTYHGNIVSFPEQYWPRALFYNKTLFAKAGIAGPPRTWAAFIADAQKLTKSGVTGFYYLGDVQDGSYTFVHMLARMGGSIFKDPANPAAGANFTSPAAQKTLDIFSQMLHNNVIENNATGSSYSDMVQAFQSGKVGMIIDGSWEIATFDPVKGLTYGVAPLPTMPGQRYDTVADYSFYIVPSTTRHPKEAVALLEWLESRANSIAWATSLGQIPAIRTSSQDSAPVTQYLNAHPAFKAFVFPPRSFAPTSSLQPQVPYANTITNAIANVLQKYLLGSVGKAQVLPQMQQAVQTVVKQNM